MPRPISVNMFGLRLTSDVQKRWKNGSPHQRTTGVASRNSSQGRLQRERRDAEVSVAMNARGQSMLAHRDRQQRRGEDDADPEAAGHVAEFGIFFLRRSDRAGLEGHAADGARSGLGAHDFRMHRAGVFGAGRGERRLGFKGHAAGGAGSGLGLADFGAHGADVGRTADFGFGSRRRLIGWHCWRGRHPERHQAGDSAVWLRYFCGSALNFSTQPAQQK